MIDTKDAGRACSVCQLMWFNQFYIKMLALVATLPWKVDESFTTKIN